MLVSILVTSGSPVWRHTTNMCKRIGPAKVKESARKRRIASWKGRMRMKIIDEYLPRSIEGQTSAGDQRRERILDHLSAHLGRFQRNPSQFSQLYTMGEAAISFQHCSNSLYNLQKYWLTSKLFKTYQIRWVDWPNRRRDQKRTPNLRLRGPTSSLNLPRLLQVARRPSAFYYMHT